MRIAAHEGFAPDSENLSRKWSVRGAGVRRRDVLWWMWGKTLDSASTVPGSGLTDDSKRMAQERQRRKQYMAEAGKGRPCEGWSLIVACHECHRLRFGQNFFRLRICHEARPGCYFASSHQSATLALHASPLCLYERRLSVRAEGELTWSRQSLFGFEVGKILLVQGILLSLLVLCKLCVVLFFGRCSLPLERVSRHGLQHLPAFADRLRYLSKRQLLAPELFSDFCCTFVSVPLRVRRILGGLTIGEDNVS